MVIVYGDSPSSDQDSSPTASTVLCIRPPWQESEQGHFLPRWPFRWCLGSARWEEDSLQPPPRSRQSVTPPHRRASVGVASPRTPVLGGGVARAGRGGPALRGESRISAAAAASFTEAGAGTAAVADLNASCSCGCAATLLRTGEPRELLSISNSSP